MNLFFPSPDPDPNVKATLVPLCFPFLFYLIFIRRHPWVLSSNGANIMAFFNSGSRTLVEVLTRMQSAERPVPVDHTFFEFGSIRYHVEASASDSENIYLLISTPSLSHEASPSSSGLPEITLEETRKMYQKFAKIIEPPKEGYVLTLKLNFSSLARPILDKLLLYTFYIVGLGNGVRKPLSNSQMDHKLFVLDVYKPP
ncbi:actin-related protein 2/3 complex subunit 2A-like [Phragmites australis]|uniref:actin-related protein 2/3 complex subunit 2A-like n=1 Tax=Phragmites australis TaxID=29695 RepID=UPI002D76B2D6|nr:actin-related protein 2/3 complex subunit 2A-like [Phragmites australis]